MTKQNLTESRIVKKLNKLGFTHVTKVKDADEPIHVKVTKWDTKMGRKKDAQDCALAKACVREMAADGAVINIGTSYVIKGNVATRYRTSVGVGREITSFDRGAGFEEGNDYLLAAPAPTMRLDAPRREYTYKEGAGKPKPVRPVLHRHHTENIRVSRRLPKR